MKRGFKSRLPVFAIGIVVLGSLLYGLPLSRVPHFSSQEAFFAYPALKAARGGLLTYAASRYAPYGDQIWAYHGPLLPRLDELLFRWFGFSPLLARLPDLVCGWLAALLIVLFLNRKGYRYAGFAFALLWCGNFSTQMLDLGRVEGLALLTVTVSFLFLEQGISTDKSRYFVLCGLACGLAVLANPLCILFALAELCAAWLLGVRRRIAALAAGAALCFPVLLWLWNFQLRHSWQQFRWHTQHLRNHDHKQSLLLFLDKTPHWALGWVIGLTLFIVIGAVIALRATWPTGSRLDPYDKAIILVSGLGVAGLVAFCTGPMFSYYLVCFLVWPILGGVMVAERHWVRFRPFAFVLALLWLFSAGGSALVLSQALRGYPKTGRQALYRTLQRNVPPDATIITTARFYAIPPGAGYQRSGLTRWFPEPDDACPSCFLLMSKEEFDGGKVTRANLAQRKILYAGPAFPQSRGNRYQVMLLSPEVSASGTYRSDGPPPN